MTNDELFQRGMTLPLLDWQEIDAIAEQITDPRLHDELHRRAVRGYHYEEATIGII